MFGYGSLKARANGQIFIKIAYDEEMQMSRLTLGDTFVELEVFLPTHKLSELLYQAYNAQTEDLNAIGHSTWVGNPQPVSVAVTS